MEKKEELIKKYNIDVRKLEREQEKLAKQVILKDGVDFSKSMRIGAVSNSIVGNKIISAVIVCDSECEIIEQEYFSDKARFPYLPGFLAYRDLPVMVQVFSKLDEKPDVVFVSGHGVAHPRGFGLASHFSLSVGVPAVGVANSLIVGEVKGEDVILDKKKIGKVLITKPGSNPMYVSPGNMISVESAYKLTKRFIRLPHKLPEPMHLARKYNREIMEELR